MRQENGGVSGGKRVRTSFKVPERAGVGGLQASAGSDRKGKGKGGGKVQKPLIDNPSTKIDQMKGYRGDCKGGVTDGGLVTKGW